MGVHAGEGEFTAIADDHVEANPEEKTKRTERRDREKQKESDQRKRRGIARERGGRATNQRLYDAARNEAMT